MAEYFWKSIGFLDQAIGKIVVTLIAAGLLAISGYILKTVRAHDAIDRLRLRFFPQRSSNYDQQYVKSRKKLITSLRNDQSTSGPHYGQFGKLWSLEEEARYQTGFEDIRAKPRMYLTLWPALILSKRRYLPFCVKLAVQGVERLVQDGRIHLFQSGAPSPDPRYEKPYVSVRHTICAAILLQILKGWDLTSLSILGAMLDPNSHWQNEDHGWRQWDRGQTKSDLWGSAYAARFLDLAIRSTEIGSNERALAKCSLENTLKHVRRCWDSNRWKLEGVPEEENIPYIFNELAPILVEYDTAFLNEIRQHIKRWFSPTGDLTDLYLKTCTNTSAASLYARLAYGIYRAGGSKSAWVPLLNRALHRPKEAINSADMAFLLDMTYLATE